MPKLCGRFVKVEQDRRSDFAMVALVTVKATMSLCSTGRHNVRSFDEAPQPSAPISSQDDVVGAVEDCRSLRGSDWHLGRS